MSKCTHTLDGTYGPKYVFEVHHDARRDLDFYYAYDASRGNPTTLCALDERGCVSRQPVTDISNAYYVDAAGDIKRDTFRPTFAQSIGVRNWGWLFVLFTGLQVALIALQSRDLLPQDIDSTVYAMALGFFVGLTVIGRYEVARARNLTVQGQFFEFGDGTATAARIFVSINGPRRKLLTSTASVPLDGLQYDEGGRVTGVAIEQVPVGVVYVDIVLLLAIQSVILRNQIRDQGVRVAELPWVRTHLKVEMLRYSLGAAAGDVLAVTQQMITERFDALAEVDSVTVRVDQANIVQSALAGNDTLAARVSATVSATPLSTLNTFFKFLLYAYIVLSVMFIGAETGADGRYTATGWAVKLISGVVVTLAFLIPSSFADAAGLPQESRRDNPQNDVDLREAVNVNTAATIQFFANSTLLVDGAEPAGARMRKPARHSGAYLDPL